MQYGSFSGFGPIGLLIGIAGLGFSIWQTRNLKHTSEKLDMTLEEINKNTNIDIQQTVVDKAIERAVEREVRLAVIDTTRRVRDDIYDEIRNEVKKEVEAQYKKITDEVSEKISEQVSNIDEYALKDRVTKRAEEKVMHKLDGCLDGALGMFNNQLGNVNKIYQNIADTISGKNNRNDNGVNLRIG